MAAQDKNYFRDSQLKNIIFWGFVLLSGSILFFVYKTPPDKLQMNIPYFCDITPKMYKLIFFISMFMGNVVLVGPFAFLSYFSQHIKPTEGKLINMLSFFDIGILLASIYSALLGWVHYLFIKSEFLNNAGLENVFSLISFVVSANVLWLFLLIMKYRSYTSNQRKELKKYRILASEDPPKAAREEIKD